MTTHVIYSKFETKLLTPLGEISNKFGYKSTDYFKPLRDISTNEYVIISHFGEFLNEGKNVVIEFTINHRVEMSQILNIAENTVYENIGKINYTILENYCKNL